MPDAVPTTTESPAMNWTMKPKIDKSPAIEILGGMNIFFQNVPRIYLHLQYNETLNLAYIDDVWESCEGKFTYHVSNVDII